MMYKLIPACAILFIVSCTQPKVKPVVQKNSYKIDTLEYPDYYTVYADGSMFFAFPDTAYKMAAQVPNAQFVEASMLSGNFVYISYKGDSDTAISGWVLKHTLKKALITPPVIAADDSAR